MKSKDCIEFVNNQCDVIGHIKIFGVKKVRGQIFGLIDPKDEEIFWLPKCQLSEIHESWIDSWINLGGEIDEGEN